jgi:hypothetical protein
VIASAVWGYEACAECATAVCGGRGDLVLVWSQAMLVASPDRNLASQTGSKTSQPRQSPTWIGFSGIRSLESLPVFVLSRGPKVAGAWQYTITTAIDASVLPMSAATEGCNSPFAVADLEPVNQ